MVYMCATLVASLVWLSVLTLARNSFTDYTDVQVLAFLTDTLLDARSASRSAAPPLVLEKADALALISHRLPSRNGRDAAETRRATKAAAGVLDSTSRRPTERNAVSASVSAVAAGNR